MDIGRERKEAFLKALPKNKSATEAIREYMDSVIEEQKKGEALNRLPILNNVAVLEMRQTCITEYDIKLFQPSKERFQKLTNLNKIRLTNLSIDVLDLQNQIRAVRRK
jgi:hypothetical protein